MVNSVILKILKSSKCQVLKSLFHNCIGSSQNSFNVKHYSVPTITLGNPNKHAGSFQYRACTEPMLPTLVCVRRATTCMTNIVNFLALVHRLEVMIWQNVEMANFEGS